MAFGSIPVDGSASLIPMSSAVPDGTNTPLAVEGGPSVTTGGNTLCPVAVYQYDGYNVTLGAKADAAASTDGGTFSLQALFKRLLGKVLVGQQTMAASVGVVLASDQSTLKVKSDLLEVSFTTTTAQAVASTDVSNYGWVSLHFVTQGTNAACAFQGSNDNTNWTTVQLQQVNSGNIATSTGAASVIFSGPLTTRYFRINVTAISAGTTAGVAEFFSVAHANTVNGISTSNNTVALTPTEATVFASAAQTTTQTQADQTNSSFRGIKVVLDMTVVGTGSVTLEIDGKDLPSGKYYSLLTGAAVVTNVTNVYTVFPGSVNTANVFANDTLPKTWRVKVTANNANSATYSVGYSYLV